MCLDDALGNGQTESRAAAVGFPCLVEPLEQVREGFGGDAFASIRYPEQDFLLLSIRADSDSASVLRELDRVADEILEDLEKTMAVGPYVRKLACDIQPKRD